MTQQATTTRASRSSARPDGIRKDVFLVSKIEATDPTEVRGAIERSLKELRTDYLDLVLIHGTPGLQQVSVPQAMKIHAEPMKLRDEKVVRHVGFSAHGYFDKALALSPPAGSSSACCRMATCRAATTRSTPRGCSRFATPAWRRPTSLAWQSWP